MANSIINDPYDFLGVKKTINAAGILTRIGGSRPSVEVFMAMEAAARNFKFNVYKYVFTCDWNSTSERVMNRLVIISRTPQPILCREHLV